MRERNVVEPMSKVPRTRASNERPLKKGALSCGLQSGFWFVTERMAPDCKGACRYASTDSTGTRTRCWAGIAYIRADVGLLCDRIAVQSAYSCSVFFFYTLPALQSSAPRDSKSNFLPAPGPPHTALLRQDDDRNAPPLGSKCVTFSGFSRPLSPSLATTPTTHTRSSTILNVGNNKALTPSP